MTDPEKIEQARRRREDELLLLLLLLSDEARKDTVVALRYDFPIQTVLANTYERAIPVIAGAMADAHADSFRRVSRFTGEDIAPPDPIATATIYEGHAREAAQAMASRLYDAVTAAQNEQTGFSAKALTRTAFDEAGYTRTNPTALDAGTERAIVFASNVGMIAASSRSSLVTGLRHISVLDQHTTEICRERDNLRLPLDDFYWPRNIPQLHWRCRSIVMPIIGSFVASEIYPITPPDPGFGVAPPGFIEALRAIAA